MKIRNVIIVLNLVLFLAFINWSVVEKEKTLKEGKLILLELAPVDPRSLMQGDYMTLSYAISRSTDAEKLPKRGFFVVKLDSSGIAQKVRIQENKTPLRFGEYLVNYTSNGWLLNLGAESYFFEEGQGKKFDKAKYGGLKVDNEGHSLLVGLYDEKRQLIVP